MQKRILIITIIIILGAGIFLAYRYFKTPAVQTKEFAGNLQSVADNSIFVQGGPFSSDDKITQDIEIDPENLLTVEIVVTADTKIIRTIFRLPTADELKETNGMFEPAKLPREQSSVGFDTLRNDFKTAYYPVSVRITSAVNVIGRQKFIAQQIEYTFPIQ